MIEKSVGDCGKGLCIEPLRWMIHYENDIVSQGLGSITGAVTRAVSRCINTV